MVTLLLLLELATLRGVSFGSRIFFPFVAGLVLGPVLAVEEGNGGTCELSFTSCLTSFGAEAVYNRTPIAHGNEAVFTGLPRDEPVEGIIPFTLEKRTDVDEKET